VSGRADQRFQVKEDRRQRMVKRLSVTWAWSVQWQNSDQCRKHVVVRDMTNVAVAEIMEIVWAD